MKSLFIMPAVVLGLAVVSAGQVAPSQNGNALDANPQLGSGGYNAVRGGVGGVNSQLYINGQVTGLGSFHGHVPYSSVDQFHGQSGSGGFDAFQRQSVGVRDAMSSQSYQASPYVSPYTSVPQIQSLSAGQIGVLPRRASDSEVQSAYANATADYQSLLSPTPVRRSGTGSGGSAYNQLPQAGGTAAALPYYGAPVDATFGAPQALRENLTKDLRRVDSLVDRRLDAHVEAWAGESDQAVTPQWNRDLIEPKTGEGAGRQPTDKGVNPGERTSPGASKNPPGDGRGASGRDGVISAKANEDVFVDLLVNMQARRSTAKGPGQGSPRVKPTPTPGASPMVPDQPTPKRPDGLAVDMGDDRVIVLHGLAGTGTDMFNLQMRKAQEKLKGGRYYDAAADFETACIIDSGNPLPRMGQGLSTFAAGEPYNAAIQFRRAMQTFPPIMETRMDVGAMIDSTTFQRQLALLDKRIAQPEEEKEMGLLFLATFLHYCANQDDAAKACAKRLSDLSADDKLMKAYAEFVLTGKHPTATTKTVGP